MTSRTIPWDTARVLDTPERQARYLSLAVEEGDPAEIAAALGVIARARGMSTIARDTGLGRESLYKSLSENGNPELATFIKVLHSLGLKLTVQPA